MHNLDESHYKKFSIQERINLTIAALSRGDTEEVSRLRRTCRRKTYVMLDSDYTNALEALSRIASHFSELHNYFYTQMLIFMSGIAITNETERIASLQMAYVDQVASIKSIYAAFNAFCVDAGLNKYHLIGFYKMDLKPMREFIDTKVMESTEEDCDFMLHLKKQFLALWNNDLSQFD